MQQGFIPRFGVGLEFLLLDSSKLECILSARLSTLLQRGFLMIQCDDPKPREVVFQHLLQSREQVLVWGVRPRIVVDNQFPIDELVRSIFAKFCPTALGTKMEFTAVADG